MSKTTYLAQLTLSGSPGPMVISDFGSRWSRLAHESEFRFLVLVLCIAAVVFLYFLRRRRQVEQTALSARVENGDAVSVDAKEMSRGRMGKIGALVVSAGGLLLLGLALFISFGVGIEIYHMFPVILYVILSVCLVLILRVVYLHLVKFEVAPNSFFDKHRRLVAFVILIVLIGGTASFLIGGSLSDDTPAEFVSAYVAPSGADASYLIAAQKAIAECGPEIYLVGVFAGREDGDGEYTFSNGNCGSGDRIQRIDVDFNYINDTVSEPEIHSLGSDSRQPIYLGDWRISWRRARALALLYGGAAFRFFEQSESPGFAHLYRERDTGLLLWDIGFYAKDGYYFRIRVNARTGWFIDMKGYRVTH